MFNMSKQVITDKIRAEIRDYEAKQTMSKDDFREALEEFRDRINGVLEDTLDTVDNTDEEINVVMLYKGKRLTYVLKGANGDDLLVEDLIDAATEDGTIPGAYGLDREFSFTIESGGEIEEAYDDSELSDNDVVTVMEVAQ